MDALLLTDLSKLCEEIDNVTMSEHNSVTFTMTIKKKIIVKFVLEWIFQTFHY